MTTIFITNDYRPAVAYTDYVIQYRKVKGNMFRVLSLLAFCRRINAGRSVMIGDLHFTAAPAYKDNLLTL